MPVLSFMYHERLQTECRKPQTATQEQGSCSNSPHIETEAILIELADAALSNLHTLRLQAGGEDLQPNGEGWKRAVMGEADIVALEETTQHIEQMVKVCLDVITPYVLVKTYMEPQVRWYLYNKWNNDTNLPAQPAVTNLFRFLADTKQEAYDLYGFADEQNDRDDYYVEDWRIRPIKRIQPGWKPSGEKSATLNQSVFSLVNDFGIPRILEICSVLAPLKRVVMYKALGIIEPEISWFDFRVKIHSSCDRLFDVLDTSIEEIRSLDDDYRYLYTSRIICDSWMKEQAESAIRGLRKVRSSHYKWLDSANSRNSKFQALARLPDDELSRILLRLTEKQRAVLLYLRNNNEGYMPSLQDISHDVGVDDSTVYEVLDTACAIHANTKVRYVGTDGKPFIRRQYPSPIIALLDADFQPAYWEQLLQPLEFDILNYIMQTNSQGQYHTYKEIEQKFSSRSNNLYLYIRNMFEKMKKIVKEQSGKDN